MQLTRAQKMMVEDGFPKELFRTPAQRHAYWEANPPRAMPLFEINKTRDESPETAAFRVQEEERRRLKSLAGIQRMKTRFETKKVDFSKVRWDARRNKFVPLEGAPVNTILTKADVPALERKVAARALQLELADHDWFRVNKDTARDLAQLNGVWDDKYAKLSGGLLVMTVTNRLKGLVKKGGEVKWN